VVVLTYALTTYVRVDPGLNIAQRTELVELLHKAQRELAERIDTLESVGVLTSTIGPEHV
jgi:hypothetical protein